jgi:hypothetical protein
MGSKNERQIELFEERLADLFRAMVAASADVANLIDRNNLLVKLEIFTYLFWILDYSLVVNKVEPSVREAINNAFDKIFKRSKHWRGLRLKNLTSYINDRHDNYTEIIRTERSFSLDFYKRIMEYQTELIAWIMKKKDVRMGFIAVPKKEADYQPIELELWTRHQIMVPLQEAYIGTILELISKIQRNANNEYFFNRRYVPK